MPRIALVNDRAAHLSELLPSGAYAISFPWTFPDCTQPQSTPDDEALCRDFVASDALYEHVTEFYARADGRFADARLAGQLTGARICRPDGYPVRDLAAMGLLPGGVEVIRRPAPADCLRALDEGEVDLASLDATLARYTALGLDLAHPMIVLESLTRIEGLRALARRDDPAGQAALDRLDAGLRAIAGDGTWFEIVQDHLIRPQG